MSRTLSGTYNTGVTLSSALDNPATLTPTAELYGGLLGTPPMVWQIVNEGLVEGAFYGIDLKAGGSVNNSGLISSSASGVLIAGHAGTIFNTGRIVSDSVAVYLQAGGSVTNQTSGVISGYDGIYELSSPLSVVNDGSIEGSATGLAGSGIVLEAGGGVTNQSGGVIGGYDGIYESNVAAGVVNIGTIAADGTSGISLYLQKGGSVTNQSGGLIAGYAGIVANNAALTVINQGTIAGINVAVRFAARYDDRQIVDPGASFSGLVFGGNTIGAPAYSTLELAAGSATLAGAATLDAAGTLNGIGTLFVDFAQITIDAGASWSLTGNANLVAGITLTNTGTLSAVATALSDSGVVVNDGSIQIGPFGATLADLDGVGFVTIGAAGSLAVSGRVGGGETIAFDPGGGTLSVSPAAFLGQIAGFTIGSTIVLAGVTDGFSPAIVNGNTLQVQRTGNPAVDLTLQPGRDYSGAVLAVSGAGAVTDAAPCFLRDTRILTERGEVPVQDLAVGDRVVTWSGQSRPIIWIGCGSVPLRPGRRDAATPIIVRRNALGVDVPNGDLRITKGHSLFLDGVLIPAEFLVNHRSILWDDHMRGARFYHIELASHDVLVANGAAAESYRDDDNRWLFENANAGWMQPPMPACAAVLTGGAIVDAMWRRLLDRAGGWPEVVLSDDADLHVVADGVRLDAVARAGDVLVFDLPQRRASVRVVSRAAVPQELGLARDARCLGVALSRIVVRQSARFRVIEMADERLSGVGFHPYEAGAYDLVRYAAGNGVRWTDGDAVLPPQLFAGFAGELELVLVVRGATRYSAFSAAAVRAAA